MSVAQILNTLVLHTAPIYIVVDYLIPGVDAGTASTDLCEVPLIARSRDHIDMLLKEPNLVATGKAYVISPNSIALSCKSSLYDFKLFNKTGVISDLLESNNEVVYYDDVEFSELDTFLGDFIIVNRDIPMTNNLYAYVNNQDGVNATGPITLTMTYCVFQDRP